jgi:hypothetical protein
MFMHVDSQRGRLLASAALALGGMWSSDADPAMQACQLVLAGNDPRSVRVALNQRSQQAEVQRLPHLTIPATLIRHEPVPHRMIAARLKRFEQRSEVLGLLWHGHAAIVPYPLVRIG